LANTSQETDAASGGAATFTKWAPCPLHSSQQRPAPQAREPKTKTVDVDQASYFLSQITIVPTDAPGMSPWRTRLYRATAQNAANPAEYFGLPENRTVAMGGRIQL